MMTGILATVNSRFLQRVKPVALVFCVASALSGCAAKTTPTSGPVFFPPPPDEPHVQYLTGVSASTDLTGKQGELSKMITGGSQTVIRIGKPYGVAAHNGKVYICDIGAAQIVVVDFVNKTMANLHDKIGPGELKKPIGVAVDEEGNVYVADNGRKDIAVYAPDGSYLKSMGKNLGHTALIGVAVYKEYVMALDNRQGKIFVLDRKSGELLSTIGDNPDKTKNMALPNGITVDKNGKVRVVNMGNGKVKEYDLDGHLLSEFGRLGDRAGEFTRPRGVAVDEAGWVYIADAGHQVVQVFNEEHRILGHFGKPGLPAGSLNLPAGVAVTKDNLDFFQKMAAPGFKLDRVIFVVNQYASPINHSLAVYGIGEMEGKKGEARERKAPAAPKKEAEKKEAK